MHPFRTISIRNPTRHIRIPYNQRLKRSRNRVPIQRISGISQNSVTLPVSSQNTRKSFDFKKTINQAFNFTKSNSRQQSSRRGTSLYQDDNDLFDSQSLASEDDDDDSSIFEKIESQPEQPAFEHKSMPMSDNASVTEVGCDVKENDFDSQSTLPEKRQVGLRELTWDNESIILYLSVLYKVICFKNNKGARQGIWPPKPCFNTHGRTIDADWSSTIRVNSCEVLGQMSNPSLAWKKSGIFKINDE